MKSKDKFIRGIAAKIKERNIDTDPDLGLIDELIENMIEHCLYLGFDDEFGKDEEDGECIVELYQVELESEANSRW